MRKLGKAVLFSVPLILLAAMLCGPALVSAADTKQVLKYYTQWEKALHSNHALANDMNQGAINDPGGHDAECMKCHTGAGAVQWSEHGFEMPGHGDKSFADKPVEAGTAVSITCTACHDSEGKIRLTGKTPKLASGYAIDKDMGTGAMCAVCHNSNRGLRNDKAFPKATQHAAHEPSQVDVIMGENFYFIETGKIDPHVDEIENTCAGCHMGTGSDGTTDHTFAASYADCADCHDASDAMKVKDEVTKEYNNLKAAIEVAIAKYIENGLMAGDFKLLHMMPDETEDKDFTTFTRGKVTNVDISYFHGRQAAHITIDNVTKFAFINVLISGGKKFLETEQGQIIAKAGWNFYMVDHDRSYGAHNSAVMLEALKVSQQKLASLNFDTLKPI